MSDALETLWKSSQAFPLNRILAYKFISSIAS